MVCRHVYSGTLLSIQFRLALENSMRELVSVRCGYRVPKKHCISARLGNLRRLCRAGTLSLAFKNHRQNPGLAAIQGIACSFFVIDAISTKIEDALHPD